MQVCHLQSLRGFSKTEESSSEAQIDGETELREIEGTYKCQDTKLQDNVRLDSKGRPDEMPPGLQIRGSRSHLRLAAELLPMHNSCLLLSTPPQLCIVPRRTDEVCAPAYLAPAGSGASSLTFLTLRSAAVLNSSNGNAIVIRMKENRQHTRNFQKGVTCIITLQFLSARWRVLAPFSSLF